MKLNGQRKVLLVVAGLACAAVAADSVMMGGTGGTPQGAEAAATAPAGAPGASGAGDAATAGGLSAVAAGGLVEAVDGVPTGPSLAERLREAEGRLAAETPDAFKARGRWAREAEPTAAAVAEGDGGEAFDAAEFARRHPLGGVMFVDLEPRAIVGGRAMRVGEGREGVVLEAIGDRWVIWAAPGLRFRVRLDPLR